MKILWIAHRDPSNPKSGGAERTIYEICTRFVTRGHQVTLLSGGWDGAKKLEYINGVKVIRCGKNLGPHLALPIILFKGQYDIVINDLGHAVPWISSVILKNHNIAFFHHLHARSLPGQVDPILAKFITSIEKLYFLIYHETVFVTESTTSKHDLQNLLIRSKNIVTIPPGVDRDLFRPGKKTKYPSIVYFGGMREYKRPQECLYLLKKLLEIRKDIRLYIVGSGPEEETVKKLAKKMGLENEVQFTGRISTESLSSLVSSCWLNVHTSITEGWGFSILEASSAGTPTIAYSVPGVVDAIENELNGLLVPEGDRIRLAESAMEIINSPEKFWRLSVEVARKYSWDRTTDLWEDLLLKIAKPPKRNREVKRK